jgi:hypothetical protein
MPEDDFHPIANLLPLLEGPDFDALVADIKAHGLRDPIWRHRNGQILDGRNRWRACQAGGVACPSRTFEGDDSEILAFIISLNLHRRHLDVSQRAMIAAELATMSRGGDRRSEDFKASIGALNDAQAAKLLNVGEKSVERAKAVKRDAVPEVIYAIKQGRLTVSSAAAIAKCEPSQQRRIAAGEESIVRLVPPKRRPDDRIRIAYSEPEEPDDPTVIRVYATDKEPPPQPDLARMVTERHMPPAFYAVRNFLLFSVPPLPPEQDAAALPADWRDELIRLAQRRQAWLAEFLRLLGGAGINAE